MTDPFHRPRALGRAILAAHCASQVATGFAQPPRRRASIAAALPQSISPLTSSLRFESDELTPPANHEDMKTMGERIIREAALSAGATEKMVDVEWKSDRIIVTIDVNKDEGYEAASEDGSVLMNDVTGEGLAEIEWDEEDEIIYDEDIEMDVTEDQEFDPEGFEEAPSSGGININLIARQINALLAQDGEDSPAFQIAKLHEIEVTTPEFDNVLRGERMFESYRGFEVAVEHWEAPKKKKKKKAKAQKEGDGSDASGDVEEEEAAEPKLKITEGKLVERDDEKGVTILNVKGRPVKIKSDTIECVRLPKAKREKGAR
ncbi:hypothetical protein ACHAXT_008001 [Thalassiosira profunda]